MQIWSVIGKASLEDLLAVASRGPAKSLLHARVLRELRTRKLRARQELRQLDNAALHQVGARCVGQSQHVPLTAVP